MRRHSLGLILSLLGALSCKTVRPLSSEVSSLQTNCQELIPLQPFLKAEVSCNVDDFFGPKSVPLNVAEERKRDLPSWISCNDVEWIDDTQDLFGPGPGNDAATLELSAYARVYNDWLGTADRFNAEYASQVFQKFDQPLPFNANNPILDTAIARTIKDLIKGAQHNIVMDIFLLGGSWGAEIMHDLGAAADRGVEVVLLHDNVSKFSVGNEMDPLWAAAKKFSLEHPNFVALDSNIHPPKRVSSVPYGLERLGGIVSNLMDLTVSAEGKSDHSKILIVDSLYQSSLDEYQQLKPRALIMSRNLVDSAASFYHDEGVVVRGPAAVVSLLNYQSDLFWAWDQAKQSKSVNAGDEQLLQSVSTRLETLRSTPTFIKGQGWVSVQPVQISANDEVRNLDSGILPRIMAAERSIDIYNRIAYNWSLAKALKEAMARGVKVRVIIDQQNTGSALGNAVFPYMIAEAPRRIAGGRETKETKDDTGRVISEADLPIKWFLPFRPGKTFGSKDRTDLAQEIHAKTIIIDGRFALFGSANLDSLTWTGGFREYSVWVEDPALASESARQFDRLWNHPLLTVSHKVWMGDEPPSAELMQYLGERQKASGCDVKAELCRIENIVQGGKDYPQKGPKRELIRSILAADADRVKLMGPANIRQDANARPSCRPL